MKVADDATVVEDTPATDASVSAPAATADAAAVTPAEPEIDYGPEEWETLDIPENNKPLPIIRVSDAAQNNRVRCTGTTQNIIQQCSPRMIFGRGGKANGKCNESNRGDKPRIVSSTVPTPFLHLVSCQLQCSMFH